MTPDSSRQSDRRPTDPRPPERAPIEDQDVEYDPGETLGRAMNLGCSLVLIAFALVSCGFIASVLTLQR
jgi:hypothetical protein